MKNSLTGAIALLAGAFVAQCQTGLVSFANYLALSPYIYVSFGSTLLGGSNSVTIGIPEMDVENGNDWSVGLYGSASWNDPASNLVQLKTSGGQPVISTLETANSDDALPGTWLSKDTAIIPVTGYAEEFWLATVQVRAWYNRGGQYTSYEAAFSANMPTGFSDLANMNDEPNGPLGLPQTPPDLPELGNIIISYPTNISQAGPLLTIKSNSGLSGDSGSNSFILTWSTNNGNFTLQSTTNTGSPMIWTNVPTPSTVVNGQNTVTNVVSGTQQFFRLANP